jgi:small conductance mechanosensitive channel
MGAVMRIISLVALCITADLFAGKKLIHAAPAGPKSLIQLIKEVKELQNTLEKTQERITSVLDQLGIQQNGKNPEDAKVLAVVTTHLEHFSRHFTDRLEHFLSDLSTTSKAVIHSPGIKSPIGINLLALLGSFFLGIFSVGLASKFLQHRIERSIFRLKFKSLLHLGRLNALLVLPMPFFLCICIILGAVMHEWGLGPFNAWYLNACTLFPFHSYCVWAMYTWIGMTWMPNRPSQGFIVMRPDDAHRTAFWLRTVVAIYAFSAFLLGIIAMMLEESIEKKAIIQTILDVGVMFSYWCVHKGLSLNEAALVLNAQPKKILRVITAMRWVFLGMTVLWMMGRSWFLHFLLPVAMTCAVWVSLFPAKELLRSFRLRFLWKRRHRDFLFKSVVTSNKISPYLADFLAYGLIGFIWYPHIEQWIDAGYWSFLSSIKSSVFSGLLNAILILGLALFIIKVGDRILKYYVEDKYSSDSLENNFLASRLKTLMAMLKAFLRVVVWIPSIGVMLSQFGGVNISAWVNSIGVASLGLTFGLQHIVRDFISGFFIILENNLMVGDEVEIDARTGKVESITIRTLKIRSDQGVLLTIPFGNIQVIGNKNRLFSAVVMNISVGYGENLDRVQALVERSFALVKRVPIFGRRIMGPLEIRGVTEVTSYSVVFQVKITTAPNMQDSIRRAFNRQLKQLFDEAGIAVPVPPHSLSKAIPSLTNTVL